MRLAYDLAVEFVEKLVRKEFVMEPAHGLYLDAKELADGLAGFETDMREQLHNLGKDVAMLTDRVDALSEQPERSVQPGREVLSESGLARLPELSVVVDYRDAAWQKIADDAMPWTSWIQHDASSGFVAGRSPRLVWTPEEANE